MALHCIPASLYQYHFRCFFSHLFSRCVYTSKGGTRGVFLYGGIIRYDIAWQVSYSFFKININSRYRLHFGWGRKRVDGCKSVYHELMACEGFKWDFVFGPFDIWERMGFYLVLTIRFCNQSSSKMPEEKLICGDVIG